MKELTKEDKARRYDEVSKEVKDFFEGGHKMHNDVTQTLEYLFPELLETEDEKIRKKLLKMFNDMERDESILDDYGLDKLKTITWLVKIGEHLRFCKTIQTGDRVTRNEDGDLVNMSQLDRIANSRKNKSDLLSCDKVEPKFKVGDWVVRKDGDSFRNGSKFSQITKIDGSMCFLDTGKCICNYEIRPWSIEDAQDGDILYTMQYNILWSYKDKTHCNYSINLNAIHSQVSIYGWVQIPNDARPACKEQRDFLSQKLKESGYEWDNEKKQVITLSHFVDNNDMVEPNPYSGTSFVYNNHTWGMCARDGGIDILCDSKLIKHIDEQKPDERKEPDFVLVPFGTDIKLENDTIIIPDGCVATIEGNRIRFKKEGKGALEAPECMYNLNEK